ncbi:MAG TPA: tetratricopeptide repeat protein [Steroidobacteraceae bacterium]|nr:tetratricopeptide repeat protein [Steroidobacteraceae bacterium]
MKRLRGYLAVGFLALGLAAPGEAGSSRATVNTNADANDAFVAGQYEAAMANYQKVLKLAERSHDVQYRAIAMYGLARANAQLCRVTEAEKWFRDSIALRETMPDMAEKAYLTQNLLEFAHFLAANQRPDEAIPYFARAPLGRNQGGVRGRARAVQTDAVSKGLQGAGAAGDIDERHG